jgi:hypothetical protein
MPMPPQDALKTHAVCFAVEHSRHLGGQPVALEARTET